MGQIDQGELLADARDTPAPRPAIDGAEVP